MKFITFKELDPLIAQADVVIEVVEARNPISTRCDFVEEIVKRRNKKFIVVLNKCDLIPRNICENWIKFFANEGITSVCFSHKFKESIKFLKKLLKEMSENKPMVVAVVGYPKVGKSSLINALKGRYSAQTSPYPGSPGYTKVSQKYRIAPGVYLIDTPGVIPILNTNDVELLIRSKPVEKISNSLDLALKLIEMILNKNKQLFKETYGIDSSTPLNILTTLAVKRGWFIGKNEDREPNIVEAARMVIRDYLNGKIRFYLPPPE